MGSHAIGAFKSKGAIKVWLRDFLPKDIPTARVLVYGYGEAITNMDTKDSITDLSKEFLDLYQVFREATQVIPKSLMAYLS